VLLAHHRLDQAETFLIQALRGGGAAGLAAMPGQVERDGLTWARPWLDRPRTAIDAYLRRHRLRFVDDASNEDQRFARGRLRATLWPVLVSAFPDAETTLARAAARAAQESALLAQAAHVDLAEVQADDDGALSVPHWLALSLARRVNVLRAWLARTLPEPVPETLVRRLADELPACAHGRWPAGSGWLRLRRRLLRFEPGHASPARQSGEASPA
jgi:tRNA(Ile)-lysidine synthase